MPSQIQESITTKEVPVLRDIKLVKNLSKQVVADNGEMARANLNSTFNDGWYGARALTDNERLHPRSRSEKGQAESDERYHQGTALLNSYLPYVQAEADVLQRIVSDQVIIQRLASLKPRVDIASSLVDPTYTIITPSYQQMKFFRHCAASVEALCTSDMIATEKTRIEWIIVNDDPGCSAGAIMDMIPDSVRSQVRILSDGSSKGSVARLNQGIEESRSEWLIFLDSDDLIQPNATAVFDHYIRLLPQCRYISPAGIDVDEDDNVLRYRRHESSPCEMFHKGMPAGHLKAVRRDLFNELGCYKPEFSGYQDYDFALRVALREPLLLVPDHLYRYRWHRTSRRAGSFDRQGRIETAVRRNFLRAFAEEILPESISDIKAPPVVERGLCIVRTQGRRLELLSEAIRSVLQQTVPMTPCVIVHGSEAVYLEVERWVRLLSGEAIILHASDSGRSRGYPLNVALDYLRENANCFGFFCFLDDDDILYPLFSTRLLELLQLSGADIAVGLSNKREPSEPAEIAFELLPAAGLVSGNFIPIHCYIVRVEFLVRNGMRFREDMDYLEDWDFLLAILAAGGRFIGIPEVVCEFRIISDGNRLVKQKPEHYEECRERVLARGRSAAKNLGMGQFLHDLAELDIFERSALHPWEIGNLIDAHRIFMEAGDARD